MLHDLAPVFLYIAGVFLIWLGIANYAMAESTRMPVRDGHSPHELGAIGQRSWSVLAVICAGILFTVFVYLLFQSRALAEILSARDISLHVGVSGLTVSLPSTSDTDPLPVLGFTLFALFSGLAWLLRRTLAFAFLIFHAGLALTCALVDLVFDAAISDPEKILRHALTSTFLVLLLGQVFFASLLSSKTTSLLSFAGSSTISSAAYFAGVAIVSVIATQTVETTLMLSIYLVIAYGIVVPHVFALSLSIATGSIAAKRPESAGKEDET